jgi:hypothetical protein
MTKALGTDNFLGHKTSAPRGSYLTKWKDRPPLAGAKLPGVNTVLKREDYAYVLWRHNLPRVVVKDDGEKVVWSSSHICWEDEKIILKQRKRLDDDTRSFPPRACGICRLLEWIYQEIAAERISWVQPVFTFEADDPRESQTLHAGGMCGMFGRSDLTDGEKAQLKKHGIFATEAWKQVAWAKASYLFVVCDYDEPAAGLQIAIESSLLGEKVQSVIGDRRASLGADEGDPSKHPFVIQWLHDPSKGISFDKKYKARAIDSLAITDEIDEIISGDGPEVDHLLKRFNAGEVRALLEEHCVLECDVPWDDFFGPAEQQQAKAVQDERKTGRVGLVDRSRETSAKAAAPSLAKPGTRKTVAAPPPVDEAEEDCGACGKPVKVSAKKCPHPGCGAIFEEEAPPPPERPRRQPIGKPAPQAKPLVTAKGATSGDAFPDDDSDEIPF